MGRCRHRSFSAPSPQIIAAAMAWLILVSNVMTGTRWMVMRARSIVASRNVVMVWSRLMKTAMTEMTRIEMVV
jgi:hypothetical protein